MRSRCVFRSRVSLLRLLFLVISRWCCSEMQFCSGTKFPQAPAKTHDRQIMCSERHVFVMKASGWHFALFVLFSVSLSVVTALVRSWKVSIISTSMILCTETSRWVRRPRTLSYTHLCSWPWQHTDGSQSPFLSLAAVFLPFLFFFSPHLLCSPPVLFFSPPFLYLLSHLSSSLSLTGVARMCSCMCAHAEHRDGESRSRGGVRLPPLARKKMRSQTMHACIFSSAMSKEVRA